jgi:hypothetical protein
MRDLDSIRSWYEEKIRRGELDLSGWRLSLSRELRWDATFSQIHNLYGPCHLLAEKLKVVDFGCGTAGMYFSMSSWISEYIGIEIRDDAYREALRWAGLDPHIEVLRDIPDYFYRKMDVVVSNAVHGLPGQDPIADFKALDRAFRPRMIVADFYCSRHPPSLGFEGGKAYDPFEMTENMVTNLGFNSFSLDHTRMPHVFTVAVVRGRTAWERMNENAL